MAKVQLVSMEPAKVPNVIEVVDGDDIIMSSPIRLSTGLRPSRIVLRNLGKEYVTHVETMHIAVSYVHENGQTYNLLTCTHEGFDNGHYISHTEGQNAALEHAKKDFHERCVKFY